MFREIRCGSLGYLNIPKYSWGFFEILGNSIMMLGDALGLSKILSDS